MSRHEARVMDQCERGFPKLLTGRDSGDAWQLEAPLMVERIDVPQFLADCVEVVGGDGLPRLAQVTELSHDALELGLDGLHNILLRLVALVRVQDVLDASAEVHEHLLDGLQHGSGLGRVFLCSDKRKGVRGVRGG